MVDVRGGQIIIIVWTEDAQKGGQNYDHYKLSCMNGGMLEGQNHYQLSGTTSPTKQVLLEDATCPLWKEVLKQQMKTESCDLLV